MHFAVYEPVWVVLPNLGNNIVDFLEVGIFATRAMGRVGKHGDSRSLAGVCSKRNSGVFYGGVELLLSGKFVDTAVGERKNRVIFLTNEATGKEVGSEWEVVFISDEDIA